MVQLSELAQIVGGQLVGKDQSCTGANPPSQASPGEVTMISDSKLTETLQASDAMAVVVTESIATTKSQIIVQNAHKAFASIVAHFRPPVAVMIPPVGIAADAKIDSTAQIHPSATIASGVTIGKRTNIMPGVVVLDNCCIGDDCVIMPNVTIYPYSQIDQRVILHAGCVIGADGFGYTLQNGKHIKSAQLGYVHLENDVELGAGVTIDRGSYGATVIGEGTKIDNQVMIGHNCQIGRHNLLCSQVGIAGSSTTGDHVIMGGQVGVKDHVHINDNAIIGAQSGVMLECMEGVTYLGSPATPQREQMQVIALTRRLPEMRKELRRLRAELDALSAQSDSPDSARRAA